MNDTTLPTTPASAPTVFTEKDAFELSLRRAKVYSASTLVPPQYQDNLPNCLIALSMARRMGADELMVMQNLYLVQNKPGWSAQFLIASFNQCGRIGAMRYEWTGAPGSDLWGCRAYATEKSTGEVIRGSWVTWKIVNAEGWNKKSGSKWLTMAEQMFMYRAGAWLVRAYAPEIAMGLPTVEELRDVIDVEPEPQAATKTDAVAAALRARLATPPETPQEAPKPLDGVEPYTPPMGVPAADLGPSYAEVAHLIGKGDLDLAGDLLRSVADEQQRAELDVLLRAAQKKAKKKAAEAYEAQARG